MGKKIRRKVSHELLRTNQPKCTGTDLVQKRTRFDSQRTLKRIGYLFCKRKRGEVIYVNRFGLRTIQYITVKLRNAVVSAILGK